jgi:hypothetical protein
LSLRNSRYWASIHTSAAVRADRIPATGG